MPFSGFLKPKPSGGRKPMIGKQIITPGSANVPINFGFHDGTGYSAGIVVPVAKVLSTETIAGQAGTMPNNPAENLGTLGKTILNLITNGNFVDTSNWSMITGSMSASANVLTTLATAQYGALQQIIPNYASYASHKLYYIAHVKSTSGSVVALLNDGVAQTATSHSGSNLYEALSGIMTINASPSTLLFKVQDNRASTWDNVYVKQVSAIDLTTTFGAGLEPTKAQMDAIMIALGGWFDGNAILTKIASGGYINNGVLGTPEVLLNDPNLIPTKIVSPNSIFGVTGTAVNGAGMKNFATGTATPSANLLTVSGLSFAPKVITVYNSSTQEVLYNDRAKAISGVTSAASYSPSAWSAGGNPTLTSNGFTISTPANISYTWEVTD